MQLAELEKQAQSSDRVSQKIAQNALGLIYIKGQEGAPQDLSKARQYFESAASGEPPLPQALHNLAIMCLEGQGGDKDEKRAVELFKQAAKLNYLDSYVNLGYLCENGLAGVKQSDEAALQYYAKAGVQNLPAQYSIARLLFKKGTTDNDVKAAEILFRAGVKSYGPAQNLYGELLEKGLNGFTKDEKGAAVWYKKAMDENHHPEATYHYACMELEGRAGVKKDLKSARTKFEILAFKGHHLAQYQYALLLEAESKGLATKLFGAINKPDEWFIKAAESKYPPALFKAGLIHEKAGYKSWDLALQCFQEAADVGYTEAQFKMGKIYEEKKEYNLAAKYFKMAADKEYGPAQKELGNLLRKGLGLNSLHSSTSNSSANSTSSLRYSSDGRPKSMPDLAEKFGAISVAFVIPSSDITLQTELGRGGFGVVYKAKKRQIDDVAVKELYSAKLSEEAERNFNREAEMMIGLRHPHIIQFYGICVEKERLWIVMEWAKNGSLYDVLRDKSRSLPWDLRLRMAEEAAKGLAYLHGLHIIHRDLKSHNLLVDADMHIKVTDFGLAIVREEVSQQSATQHAAAGSLAWMAPELFDDQQPNEKTDAYSYGITTWELATRKKPFEDIKVNLIPLKVSQGERPIIPEECPAVLREIIMRCWDKDPALRLSMREVVEKFHPTVGTLNNVTGPQYDNNLSRAISGPQYQANTAPLPPSLLVNLPPPPISPVSLSPPSASVLANLTLPKPLVPPTRPLSQSPQ
jgi:serine/threonine protein kinase